MKVRHYDKLILDCQGEIVKCYNAIIGFRDGSIKYINYDSILFTDRTDVPLKRRISKEKLKTMIELCKFSVIQ